MSEVDKQIMAWLLDGGFVPVQRPALLAPCQDLMVEIEKPGPRPGFYRVLKKIHGRFVCEEVYSAGSFYGVAQALAQRGEAKKLEQTEGLEQLLRQVGTVVSKDDLSQRALGRKLTRYDRSIDVHMSHLRGKLGPLDDGRSPIQTIRGLGYQLVAEPR